MKKMYEVVANEVGLKNPLSDKESSNIDYLSYHRTSRGKRSAPEDSQSKRRNRRREVDGALKKILERQTANATSFIESLNKNCPYPMTECLIKLHSIPNITTEAIIAMTEAITQNNDNKPVLMTWDGDLLRGWIDYVVSCHPRFGKYSAWV